MAKGVYRKRMSEIRRGDVVAGEAEGWWRVTRVDHDRGSGTVVLSCTNTVTGHAGELYGNARDFRDLVNL